MGKKKIKLLGIAPYEGMDTIMQKIALEREDIELEVYVGDLEKGVGIALKNLTKPYAAILSRGGTAQLLEQNVHIPVIDVGLSVYDVLRVIKLAENYANRYAIMGFPGITANAHILCDLLQIDIDIFTVHSQDEVESTLLELKQKGYQMVLCDMIARKVASRLGLNALLITSGAESIRNAFDQAVTMVRSIERQEEENQLLQEILLASEENMVLTDSQGNILRSYFPENSFVDISSIIREEISAVMEKKTRKFFKSMEDTLYAFTCKKISLGEKDYGVFYFSATSIPFAKSKYGIKYSTQQDVEDSFFDSFYSILLPDSSLTETFDHLNGLGVPILISGEPGSGKEQAARNFYGNGSKKHHPLITINCTLLNERSWNFLVNHYNSPLNDNENTIYIKDFPSLDEEHRKQLLSLLIDTHVCKRNQLIFSCDCARGESLPPEALEYVNMLSCVVIHLSSLREHTDKIPNLASLWLNKLNLSMTNQIIGLEPEALDLLQAFEWPYNYTQFKRVLQELALSARGSYIQAEQVAALLGKEPGREALGRGEEGAELDLDRTLAEINREVIRRVMAKCGGNQSAAAKSLGIGRSTLWRYLKMDEE